MLIDKFAQQGLEELYSRASTCVQPCELFLLIDGAFVSGIHKLFKEEEKRVFFDTLPSCRDETRNVSPFLIRFNPSDQRQQILLDRSSGWPMLSLIQTPESLVELFTRLAAWCIVEVDRDRYNFRFADTRRLPAIISNLTCEQLSYFLGPVQRWSFIGRDGSWADLNIPSTYPRENLLRFDPVLQKTQFTALLNDSRVDEILAVMAYRGEEIACTNYERWIVATVAISAADAVGLGESDTVEWAVWCVKNQPSGEVSLVNVLQTWCKEHATHDNKPQELII